MEKKVNTNEVYYYLRGKAKGPAPKRMRKEKQNGPPLVTVCLSQLPDGTVCQGVAICSPRDIPNKKEGRRIARNYMLKALGTKKTGDPVQRDEAGAVGIAVGKLFRCHSFFNLNPSDYGIALLNKLQK